MSARDRRALVLGASIIGLSLFGVFGLKPFIKSLADDRERLASERETLSRERAAVDAARRNPHLQQVADSAMSAVTPRLFEGRDDGIAGAELDLWVTDVAHRSRVFLPTVTTRTGSTSPAGIRTLRSDIRGESDLRGILTFLRALETGDKLVRVERLDLSRLPNASEDDETETLSMAATIIGFALPSDRAAGDPMRKTTAAASPTQRGTP